MLRSLFYKKGLFETRICDFLYPFGPNQFKVFSKNDILQVGFSLLSVTKTAFKKIPLLWHLTSNIPK